MEENWINIRTNTKIRCSLIINIFVLGNTILIPTVNAHFCFHQILNHCHINLVLQINLGQRISRFNNHMNFNNQTNFRFLSILL